jgi:hypothetical protein
MGAAGAPGTAGVAVRGGSGTSSDTMQLGVPTGIAELVQLGAAG